MIIGRTSLESMLLILYLISTRLSSECEAELYKTYYNIYIYVDLFWLSKLTAVLVGVDRIPSFCIQIALLDGS